MASIWTVHLHSLSSFPLCALSNELRCWTELGIDSNCMKWNRRVKYRKFAVRAVDSDDAKGLQYDAVVLVKPEKDNVEKTQQNPFDKLQQTIGSLPLVMFSTGKLHGMSFAVGLGIVTTMLLVIVRGYASRKSRNSHPGSVADLVRRGQIKSDRRGISTPLKYEDPFNNPMVKVSKNNSSVEMCGKVYRLSPVILTDEQQKIHQKRRSRAYQWKRPTTFLKEGESVPADVDPDAVRWIPANHPFATTSSEIDEDLAKTNVHQKNGVPFRIRAEHEALQRKLETLQNEQKLGKLVIDPAAARDFERPLKSHTKPEIQLENGTSNSKSENKPPSDEMQIP